MWHPFSREPCTARKIKERWFRYITASTHLCTRLGQNSGMRFISGVCGETGYGVKLCTEPDNNVCRSKLGLLIPGNELLRSARHCTTPTPSAGLRHPSLEEGAGKRCSECVYDPCFFSKVNRERDTKETHLSSNHSPKHRGRHGLSCPVLNQPYGFCGRKAPCLLTYCGLSVGGTEPCKTLTLNPSDAWGRPQCQK